MTETTDLRTRLLTFVRVLTTAIDNLYADPHRDPYVKLTETTAQDLRQACEAAAAALPPAPNPEDVQADLDAWKVWQGKQPAAPPVSEGTRRPLCRCPDGFCWLHPGLTTCGMRATSVLPRAETPLAGTHLRPCETLGCGCFYDSLGRLAVACQRHTGSTLPRAADPAGGETPAPPPDDRLLAACRYWEAKKLALDAVRPDFTRDQLRELNAAEGRLLAAISERLRGEASSAPASQEKTR